MVAGQPVLACRRKPEQMEGRAVTTLEGLPEEMGRVIGESLVLECGAQCGFCTPGIAVRTSSLIQRTRTADRESIEQALIGHVCRCTGYARIIDAIQTAGELWNNGRSVAGRKPRRHFCF